MSDLLQQGIAALKAGDKTQARQLLSLAVRQNPQSEQAWLWLSGALDDDQERLACLNKVLAINPDNEAARRGVTALRQKMTSQPAQVITPQAEAQLEPRRQIAGALDELSPGKREALENLSDLVAYELAHRVSQRQIVKRLTERGFPQRAVEQFVNEIARQEKQTPKGYEERSTEPPTHGLSPWLTIWTSPRATIRSIVDSDPKRHVLVLAMLGGFAETLGNALSNVGTQELGSILPLPIILLFCAIAGPIGGLISLYLSGFLLTIAGDWLGGRATSVEVRAAIAWSSVPRIWALILWVPSLALFGFEEDLFTSTTSATVDPVLATIAISLAVVQLVIEIWALIVFLQCLGEVHRFSAWRALGASLLSGVMVAVPILCFGCALIALVSQR
jgi:tetratricopeptide (TPR) repeat protein